MEQLTLTKQQIDQKALDAELIDMEELLGDSLEDNIV